MPDTRLANRRHVLGIGLSTEALKYFAGWIAAAIVLAVVVPLVIAQYLSIDVSSWFYAANAGKIFSAIVAGTFLFVLLPLMVAQGLTRREVATAMGWFGLLWSAALGVLAVAGYLGEHALYGALGWSQVIQQDAGDIRLDSIGAAVTYSLPIPLLYLLYFTGGLLIGAASYRWNGGWLIFVPVVPTVLGIDAALSGDKPWGPTWFQSIGNFTVDWGTWPAVAATAIVVTAGMWITRRILINTPIRAKRA